MWIERQIEPLLLQRAATRPVVVLTGARQTGNRGSIKERQARSVQPASS